MPSVCAHTFTNSPFSEAKTVAAAHALREASGRVFQTAFAFVSSDYLPHLAEFCDILRVEGRILDVVGCTASGILGTGIGEENGAGFSILAISAPESSFEFHQILPQLPVQPPTKASGCRHWISLLNPHSLAADGWLQDWNAHHPQNPISGALATGSGDESTVAVFHNGQICELGILCAWQGGSLRAGASLSQGCRPIGEPLTVTRAENNVVFALGAHPAYQALESAFQSLSNDEKAVARGNLLAGLASTEYVDDFSMGDFLIRPIIGADQNSGAVVIAGVPRIGQTLQYQFRDRQIASLDLQNQAGRMARTLGNPVGCLLFSCVARGKGFFPTSAHDAERIAEILGPVPLAGFFCNGELGPVHATNALSAFSASLTVFYDED